MRNTGKRARFRDALEENDENIRLLHKEQERMMDSLQSAYEDFLKLCRANLKLTMLCSNRELDRLYQKLDHLEANLLSVRIGTSHLNLELEYEQGLYDYWCLPWWKRLFKKEPK